MEREQRWQPRPPPGPPGPRRISGWAISGIVASAIIGVLLITIVAVAIFDQPSTTSKPSTALQIIAAMKSAGVPIDDYQSYTRATDPEEHLGQPHQYTSVAVFADRRLANLFFSLDTGGIVEVFANQADLQHRLAYLHSSTPAPEQISPERDYTHGRAILRLSDRLRPPEVRQYQRAFDKVTG